MEEFESSHQGEPAPRPGFLTVLCILSFIGGTWGLFSNVQGYMSAELTGSTVSYWLDSAMTQIKRQEAKDPGVKMAERLVSEATVLTDPGKIRNNSLLSILSNLLTLTGTAYMFQQRRQGYWIYLAGIAVMVAAPLIVFGTGNIISIVIFVLECLIGLIFGILYALNIKHMH